MIIPKDTRATVLQERQVAMGTYVSGAESRLMVSPSAELDEPNQARLAARWGPGSLMLWLRAASCPLLTPQPSIAPVQLWFGKKGREGRGGGTCPLPSKPSEGQDVSLLVIPVTDPVNSGTYREMVRRHKGHRQPHVT